jgi:enoyl-CoA hydratase
MTSISERMDGDVLVVTLDRPGHDLNRIDGAVHRELAELVARLKGEMAARAVVLRAEGRAFSAGGDHAWFPSLQEPGALEALRREGKQLIWDLLDVPVPVVVALEGSAIGLAASIVLLCDAVVMAESATIADPHVRVGVAAGDGGTVAWPIAVGPMVAKRYLLTGDAVTAAEALRLGLVTDVVPDGEADAAALALARRFAAGAPLAVRYTKQALNQAIKEAMATSFDLAMALELVTFASADHAEALAAFKEKREPRFEGR